MDQSKKESFYRFSHAAMGTVFEVKISKAEHGYAKAAAAEAFLLLDTLEQYLSHYIANSDISRISNLQPGETTRVSLETFECLIQCVDMYSLTGGVFDVTIGRLYKTWLDENMALKAPSGEQVIDAREHVGLYHLSFDEEQFQVGMNGGPVTLDLGGFGKGYALDKMSELLKEWDLDSFLLNGGQSTMLFGEAPQDENGWNITLSDPFNEYKEFQKLSLKNIAVSGSGLQKGRHIIDPRNGEPIDIQRSTWAFAPTAAFADGLSTSFMILSLEEIEKICATFPEFKAVILHDGPKDVKQRLMYYGEF